MTSGRRACTEASRAWERSVGGGDASWLFVGGIGGQGGSRKREGGERSSWGFLGVARCGCGGVPPRGLLSPPRRGERRGTLRGAPTLAETFLGEDGYDGILFSRPKGRNEIVTAALWLGAADLAGVLGRASAETPSGMVAAS